MGTPEFAVPTLLKLSKSGHVLVAVYTRPPARSGARGLEIRKTPVHVMAEILGIPIITPRSLRDVEAQKNFENLAADIVIVVAYGLMLPIAVLEAPRYGCLNLHASLLPRWRGAAPIQRAIMAGDTQSGVDVMRMVAGLDAGPIAIREVVQIRPDETGGDLTTRLAAIGAKLSLKALQWMEDDLLMFHEQSTLGACYAYKIEKHEAEIDWTHSAEMVRSQIQALSPTPGAFSKIRIGNREENVKFLRAEIWPGNGPPGMLLSEDMVIACGVGGIRVLQAQRPGKTAMSGGELMRGATLALGTVFTRSRRLSCVPEA